ncbi:DUF1616 domain-containing protein [Haloarchaeobius sp. HRN-SO-5]|uniref:DUF1616 domain-containing protein n=1 Tax=Haloarchaeobius sp. HRN-SO-5 TaxID=3446118 RepID=UPI003EB9967F
MSGTVTRGGSVERRSYDLAAVGAYAVVAYVLLSLLGNALPTLRVLLGAPLVLFAPGYAVVSALLPVRTDDGDGIASLDRLERVALAFGTSVCLVVLGTLAVSPAFPAGLSTVPFLELIVTGTVLATVAAYANRLRYPAERRDGLRTSRERPSTAGSATATFLEVALAVSVVLAIGAVGSGFAAPQAETPHTNAALLTEGPDGKLVADGYVEEVGPNEQVPVTLALENEEGHRQTYTVIVALERVQNGSDGPRVVQRTQLDRMTVEVPAGEAVRQRIAVTPDALGEQLRISYYVFLGDPGESPTASEAYRHLFLWVTVSDQQPAAVDDPRAIPLVGDP